MEDELDLWLERSARGDRGAYASFIRATNREIFGLCLRLVGPAEAEDATQEIYLALWRSLGSFRRESSARTFLYVIARRVAARSAARHRRWQDLASLVEAGVSVDEGALSLELAEALGSLDEDKRTALVLTSILGYSYAEAAEICGCKVGTIRSRVARAREQLSSGLTAREAG